MQTNKLAICIPTYNRAKIIEGFLDNLMPILSEYKIDIIIFDSSEKDETERIVDLYINQGYTNLSLHHIDSQIKSNRKVFDIYKKLSNDKYEYIWITHDHTYYRKEVIDYIWQVLDYKCDFYSINIHSMEFSTKLICSLDEFLENEAMILSRFGASIVRVDTFLRSVDWNEMCNKYLNGRADNWAHVGLYYEIASSFNKCKICRVNLSREYSYDVTRNMDLPWEKERLDICWKGWGYTITNLPSIYSYEAKHRALSYMDPVISNNMLIEYKRCKKYGLFIYLKYKKWIDVISPSRRKDFLLIALLPYCWTRKILDYRFLKLITKEGKNNKILIYGAGRHGCLCAQKLQDVGVEFDGFIVHSMLDNPTYLLNHRIYLADEYLKKESALVLIAISKIGIGEVISHFDKLIEMGYSFSYMYYDVI